MTIQFTPEDATAVGGKPISQAVPVALPLPIHRTLSKSVFDRAFAFVALVLLSPVLVIVGLLVALTSRGPIVFGHERVGKDGKAFKCFKFRTMVQDAEARLEEALASDPAMRREWDTHRKLSHDPRITSLGRILRKTSLDELPQFWNVLIGDMSIVGPRPVVEAELEKYASCASHYLSVRPGITGAWQTNGRSDVSYSERVAMDVDYVRTMSLWGDIKIVLKTVRVVLMQVGAH